MAPTNEGLWLSTGDGHQVEFLDWSGRTVRAIRWSGPDQTVTSGHVEAYREQFVSSRMERSDAPGRAQQVRRWWLEEEEQLPELFPSVQRMLLSKEGGLWVQWYRRPGDAGLHWVYFDTDGQWVRTLRLPDRTRLMDAGSDWVLVGVSDLLDRERLYVYALEAVVED